MIGHLELKQNRPATKKKAKRPPPWKQRMDATIKNKRRALSQLTELKQKRLKNQKNTGTFNEEIFS